MGFGRPRTFPKSAAVLSAAIALSVAFGPGLSQAEEPDCRREAAAGEEFFRQSRFGEACESFALAVAVCPDDPGAWAGLGRSALASGDAAAAVQAFRQALRLAPGELDRREALASAYAARAGESRASADSALAIFSAVLREDPSRVAAYRAAAEVHERLSDLPSAIMMEMQARLAAGQSASDGWPEALGRALLNARIYSEAARVYGDCAARASNGLECRRVDAYLRFRLGRWEEAAHAYEAILREAPETTTAESEERNLAESLARLGRLTESAARWDRLAVRVPEVERYVCEAVWTRLAAGRRSEALRIADAARGRHPDWECLRRLGAAAAGDRDGLVSDPACVEIGLRPGAVR